MGLEGGEYQVAGDMAHIQIVDAGPDDLPAAQRFYDSRRYGGAAIRPSDFVVLARHQEQIVGIGRLSREHDLLWLRGMQVQPEFQRSGVGTRILDRLSEEIGPRWCCCLPYDHLVAFYRRGGFGVPIGELPPPLSARLQGYRSGGLQVVAMVRPARAHTGHPFGSKQSRGAA